MSSSHLRPLITRISRDEWDAQSQLLFLRDGGCHLGSVLSSQNRALERLLLMDVPMEQVRQLRHMARCLQLPSWSGTELGLAWGRLAFSPPPAEVLQVGAPGGGLGLAGCCGPGGAAE